MIMKLVENPTYVMYKDAGSAGFRYIVCVWNRTKKLNGYFF